MIKAIAALPLLKGHKHKKLIKASFTKVFSRSYLIAAVQGATLWYGLMAQKLLSIFWCQDRQSGYSNIQNMKILNIWMDDMILFSDWKSKKYFSVGSNKIAMRLRCAAPSGFGPHRNNGSTPNVVVKSGPRTIPSHPYSLSNAVSTLPCLDSLRDPVI